MAHKEAATLGEGLLSWFPKILQVKSQAFIWAAGLLPMCRYRWRWWPLLLLEMLTMLRWTMVLLLQVKGFISLHPCTLYRLFYPESNGNAAQPLPCQDGLLENV